MVGRRDVHPNKNVHVVAESCSDVKESKMVIDEYIERKKEKMMREKEMLEKMSESDGERETPASGAAIETNDAKSSDSSSSYSSSKKGRESRSRKSASRKNSKKMKAGKQEREEQSSTEEAKAKTTTIVENITPKTLLETVRDVKHVHEAEKKVKENGGSLIDVVAEIQEKEEESDGSVNSSSSSSSKAEREGEGGGGEEEENLNDDDTDDTEETTTATTAVVPGSVAVLGPQTNEKNSIESIELISNATSQNAQSWGIEDGEEKNDDEENPEEETTTTTKRVKTKLRSSSKNKKEKHWPPT